MWVVQDLHTKKQEWAESLPLSRRLLYISFKLRRYRRTLHSTRSPKIDVFINFCTFMILSLELEPGCDPSFGCFTLRFMNQHFRNQIQNHSNPGSINPGWLKIGGSPQILISYNMISSSKMVDARVCLNEIWVWHSGSQLGSKMFQVTRSSSRARHSVGTSSPPAAVLWALTAPRTTCGDSREEVRRVYDANPKKKRRTWDFTDSLQMCFQWWDCIGSPA